MVENVVESSESYSSFLTSLLSMCDLNQSKKHRIYSKNSWLVRKSLDKKEMGDIVHELYHYPSDHIDIIKTMRQWKKQQQQQQQQHDEIEINNQ